MKGEGLGAYHPVREGVVQKMVVAEPQASIVDALQDLCGSKVAVLLRKRRF